METPLSPLDFMRRARRLYPDREAVVDGDRRLTYEQFFDRCDRWSSVLQGLGVGKGDRVAYIAPNTHAQLESFYAVPQIGAVLVPINYRLIADDFAYIINHSGATVVCVHGDYLEAVDGIRDAAARRRRTSWPWKGRGTGWLDYEELLASGRPATSRSRRSPRRDLLTINYTSGTTSRPKGRDDHPSQRLHERGRHADPSAYDARPIATCGLCRCSTPTAGPSSGSSPPWAARMSACGGSSRAAIFAARRGER